MWGENSGTLDLLEHILRGSPWPDWLLPDGIPQIKGGPRPTIPHHVLVFNGREWIYIDVRSLPPEYFRPEDSQELALKFMTNRRNGLFWFTGDADKHMFIMIKV